MKMRKNARLTPLRREEMARRVAGQLSHTKVAASFGVTAKTAAKRAGRFQDPGPAGRPDRSSRPRCLRGSTPRHVVERIVSLRRCRLTRARAADLPAWTRMHD